MYKLLLAEDESSTREGILEGIDWNALGIGVVEAEKNGLLAHETALTLVPDILLTDIKMPRMNGIDLSFKVREINPDCSILMLSGYSEVDYLKSAIALSALNFVNKPVDLKVLESWLKKCVEAQDSIRKRREFLRREVSSLLTRPGAAYGDMAGLLRELRVPVHEDTRLYTAILRLFEPGPGKGDGAPELELAFRACCSVLEGEKLLYAVKPVEKDLIYLHIFDAPVDAPGDKETAPAGTADFFRGLRILMEKALAPLEVFMAVGEPAPVSDAYPSFQSALRVLDRLFFSREKRLLFGCKTAALADSIDFFRGNYQRDVRRFTRLLENRDADGAEQLIRDLTRRLSVRTELPVNNIIQVYFDLMLELMKRQTPYSAEVKYDFVWEWLSKCIFLADVEKYVLACLFRYFDAISPKASADPIGHALDIIHSQYESKELSLNRISRQVFLSPAYICVKFKEATGKTLTQYLTEYRIEAAVRLLEDKSHKIQDIAEKVGFDSGSYFSKTFKKIKGVTPAEYRDGL